MHTTQTKRTKSGAPAAQRKSTAPMTSTEAQRAPAYARRTMQPKVAVGPANDSFEHEADSVAQRVASGQNIASDAISSVPSAAHRPPSTAPKQVTAPPLSMLGEKKPVQKASAHSEEQKPVQKAEAKNAPGSAGRQMGERPTAATRDSITQGNEQKALSEAAEHAIANKGPGRPLNPGTQQTLSQRMGLDLNHVRIHDGPAAHEACRALHARAFTHGNDIWIGSGESDTDITLMAHEVTHVVQQTDHVHRKTLQRKGGANAPFTNAKNPNPALSSVQRTVAQRKDPPASKSSNKKPKEVTINTLVKTAIDSKDMATIKAKMPGNQFRRTKGYTRKDDNPKQDLIWDGSVKHDVILSRLKKKLGMQDDGLYSIRAVGESGYEMIGTPSVLAPALKRPFWNEKGAFMRHEVDHKVELVFTGYPVHPEIGHHINNMELLDKGSNGAAGIAHRQAIDAAIATYLTSPKVEDEVAAKKDRNAEALRANYDIIFTNLKPAKKEAKTFLSVYSREDIEKDAVHINYLGYKKTKKAGRILVHDLKNPTPADDSPFSPLSSDSIAVRVGSKKLFRLYTKPGGGRNLSIKLPANPKEVYLPGYKVKEFTLDPEVGGDVLGSLKGEALPKQRPFFKLRGDSPWPIRRFSSDPAFKYAGYLAQPPITEADMNLMSPIRIDDTYVDEAKGFTLIGQVLPTVPMIRNLGIDLVLQGDDIRLQRTFQTAEFQLPGPIKATGGSVTVGLGTESGLSIDGRIELEIEKVGQGFIRAAAGTKQGFELEGEFTFDPKLVDNGTKIRAWYKQENGDYDFGIAGEMHIKEGKIKGVKAATITASYSKGKFTADGNAQLSIKGFKQAALHLDYDEKEGLNVNGSLELEKTKLVKSGGGTVNLKKKEGDAYHISGAGTVVPNVPGVSVAVAFAFVDDAFQAEGAAAFEKGMLKGAVALGVTNRPIGDDGKPAEGPPKDLRIYGGGIVTIQLAPWLQGTAGIKILPNGEIEMVGAIGLPSALKLFDEKKFDKNIFKVHLDIPIVGLSFAGQNIGIFATIGGGLDLSAGVGPGELQDVGVQVTYNPSHEEDTHIRGGANLHIPAHAGLRLFVRGGLGAGIPLVNATAGLEIGGELGLAGALDAGVQVDWSPKKGLVLNAKAALFVEPKLKFDVKGFVSVDVDYVAKTMNLYERHWDLAAFEWGSGLRFGVEFPVHYEEGKPFNVSLDDLKFTVPAINASDVLSGLVKQITD